MRAKKRRGSVLIMILVILGMFMVMTIAAVSFINRQYHVLSQEEQERRAFNASEAGVHYALFLLGKEVETTEELLAGPPITRTISLGAQEESTFVLTFSSINGADPGQGVIVTSEGHDSSNISCQTIVATISHAGGGYAITSWDHAVPCGGY